MKLDIPIWLLVPLCAVTYGAAYLAYRETLNETFAISAATMRLTSKIRHRLNGYRGRFQVNNPIVGRVVELAGNKVRMDGLTYSVESPQITRGHKSTLAFGLHEMEERELIRKWMPSDVPVVEFGGGLGVVSCLTNTKLSDPKKHVVVEANPAMVSVLDQNRELNGCQFEIVNRALAYGSETIDLNLDSEFAGSSIKGAASNIAKVKTTSLKSVMDSAGFDQAGVICDIEGAEADLIANEAGLLSARVRFVMAEMHPQVLGEGVVHQLMNRLNKMGFELREQIQDCVFLSKS